MNYRILLALLFLVLLARLRFTFRDEGAKTTDLIIIGAGPLLSLVFLEFNYTWIILLLFFPGMAFLSSWTENRSEERNLWRLLHLIIYIFVLAILCSPLGQLTVNELPIELVDWAERFLIPGHSIEDPHLLDLELYLFGGIVVLNEMNIVLRYLLHLLQIEPQNHAEEQFTTRHSLDTEEYNTGRVIGMLERLFVYIFILAGQYAAIGFILAAKGLVRFREFEHRTFAEYVLIGTLLSTLLALLIGYFVRWAALF